MGAYNWVTIFGRCPNCGDAEIRCQTHTAADYGGEAASSDAESTSPVRFHDREYRLLEVMAWWRPDDRRFESWRAGTTLEAPQDAEREDEACYATCNGCLEELRVVLRFRALVPTEVVSVHREHEWPSNHLR